MARRKKVYNRPETRDPRYDSPVVGKLISPLEVVTRAIENAKPRVEVKSRRVGGATYQVPLEVDANRSESLAMRWLVNFARAKKGTPMHVALSNEIKDAANNQGNAVRKRDDMHKMAQANRAFAHFRW